jgi:hypothetical protein
MTLHSGEASRVGGQFPMRAAARTRYLGAVRVSRINCEREPPRGCRPCGLDTTSPCACCRQVLYLPWLSEVSGPLPVHSLSRP